MKYNVVSVAFSGSNRKYYFSPNNLNIKKGDYVVVESEKGNQFGKIECDVFEIDESKLLHPLKNVLRVASSKDININNKNREDSNKALDKARQIVKDLKLDMILLSSYYTFDRSQLVFNFIADERVDFRELAKNLASIYKTRIELRQIGVRDKAKEVGGLGPCGRFLCCNLFLNEFDSVSINMAKNQYISLKPNKINGICGRLLCCLNYEDEQYTEEKKRYPSIGSMIKVKGNTYKVVGVNLFKNSFTVEKSDKSTMIMDLEEYESTK